MSSAFGISISGGSSVFAENRFAKVCSPSFFDIIAAIRGRFLVPDIVAAEECGKSNIAAVGAISEISAITSKG